MKLLKRLAVAFALAVPSLALLPVTGAFAETVLRFNRWLPPTHPLQAVILTGWAADVEAATAGRVKVEFTASSLGAPARQFDLAATGVADVVLGNQTYTPERFVLSGVGELPFLGSSAEALSVAQWRVHEQLFAAANEYEGTKVLGIFGLAPFQIYTSKEGIENVDQLSGLKFRAPPGIGTLVSQALGVVPVNAPPTEAYDMISKGIVDGTFTSSDTLLSFGLNKFLNNQIPVPDGLYNAAFFVAINQARWDSLSAEDRAAIEGLSGEALSVRAGKMWDTERKKADEALVAAGMKVATPSAKFYEDLKAKLDPIELEWVKAAAQRGVDGTAALALLRSIVAEYGKK